MTEPVLTTLKWKEAMEKTVQPFNAFPPLLPSTIYKDEPQTLKAVNIWLQSVHHNDTTKITSFADLFTETFTPDEPLCLTCTDERNIIWNTLQPEDKSKKVIRVIGGAEGFLDALEETLSAGNRTLGRERIIAELRAAGLAPYNHIDNIHGCETNLVGCGYCGLLASNQSEAAFGKHIINVHQEVVDLRDRLHIPVVTLASEHVAQNGGLLINLYPDRALNPEGRARNSFFSLDLGVLRNRLKTMAKALELTEKEQEQTLVNIVRNNMAGCYVLSGGAIDANRWAVVGETNPDLTKIIDLAYRDLCQPKRLEALNKMIAEKKKSAGH